jgi:hypothetical protein
MRCLRRRPPYTVVAYLAVVAAVLLALLINDPADRGLFVGGPLLILASLGLLEGFWLAWLFLALVSVGSLVGAPFMWPAGWTVVINGLLLALLLTRPTRSYARRGRPGLFARLGA